ncbi:MAG: hypothetical protein IPF96_08690 [Rhodobacter sp.]|nr:hypothetical protein [Rhodobacter sp.]
MRLALVPTLLFAPSVAFACALPPSVILTLPTGHYIAAAALTVALTALLGAAAGHMPQMRARLLWERPVLLPVVVTSYLSFLVLLGLVVIGHLGSRDPMHNLMTLVFWTGVWIVVPMGSVLFGNLWRAINPWTGPVRIARILLRRRGGIGLSRLGHWPAVGFYIWFIWFQMISLYPDDPAVLARAAATYWAIIFVLAVAEGEDWLQRGEFLTVLFGLVARIAPFWLEIDGRRARLMAGWPGAQVLRMPPLDRSAQVFVALALAALTFDGLNETFWWQALIGQNSLEPVGRSAVVWHNSAGIAGVFALTLAALWAGIALGSRVAGGGFRADRVMLSFLAIASGYHAAHYLVMLLTAGQYTIAAVNDPFFTGANWLGLPPFFDSFGFLTDARVMPLIYATQFLAILGAHLLAVILSLRLAGPVRALAHLPLTGLMVGYTILGLWLLSTARVG